MVSPLSGALGHTSSSGGNTSQFGQASSSMVYRVSSDGAAQFCREADSSPRTPRMMGAGRMHPSPAARSAAATCRRRRSQLSQLLAAALVVAMLSGTTSYRMHMAEHRDGDDWAGGAGSSSSSGGVEWHASSSRSGPLAGLRSWLAGSSSASRRSLREGPPGLDAVSLAVPRTPRPVASVDPGLDAAGAHQFDRWWMLDGFAQLAAVQQQQQQPQDWVEQGAEERGAQQDDVDAGKEGEGATPLQRLLQLRRLQPSAFRLYDFKEKSWAAHNVTRIPVEVPVARWAVASLLNKAKKKESIIFLLGGYASPHEVAARRSPRPPKTDTGGGVTLRTAGAGSSGGAGGGAGSSGAFCPLASVGAYAVNTGRSRFRPLPALPEGRYGGSAVITGARLHFLGGWATPDENVRLAQPVAAHWSIGLNADGSSAPEWELEQQLPAELVGRRLAVWGLSPAEEGEPAIYAWTDGSSDSAPLGTGEEACYADLAPQAASGSGRPVQLWSFQASTGWQKRGLLPQPLADDIQCAVPISPHELLAVGSVEQSGLFTQQRGLWQYDAQDGGKWTRAGWAHVKFAGQLCALHHNRLFTSGGLPPLPEADPTQTTIEAETRQALKDLRANVAALSAQGAAEAAALDETQAGGMDAAEEQSGAVMFDGEAAAGDLGAAEDTAGAAAAAAAEAASAGDHAQVQAAAAVEAAAADVAVGGGELGTAGAAVA